MINKIAEVDLAIANFRRLLNLPAKDGFYSWDELKHLGDKVYWAIRRTLIAPSTLTCASCKKQFPEDRHKNKLKARLHFCCTDCRLSGIRRKVFIPNPTPDIMYLKRWIDRQKVKQS